MFCLLYVHYISIKLLNISKKKIKSALHRNSKIEKLKKKKKKKHKGKIEGKKATEICRKRQKETKNEASVSRRIEQLKLT